MIVKIQEVRNTEEAYAAACVWEYIEETRRLAEGHAWARPMQATWKEIGTVSMRYTAMSLGPIAHAIWEDMTPAQREGYTGVDDGFDWGFIPAFVRAVVWTGKGYKPFDKVAFIKAIAGHIEGAPFKPSHPMAFEYFEVRPCLEVTDTDGEKHVDSFTDEALYDAERALLDANAKPYETFWTVYGRYNDGNGAFLAEAIADRSTKQDAHKLLYAILAPMAAARDLAEGDEFEAAHQPGCIISPAERAAGYLADVINQSSNEERI